MSGASFCILLLLCLLSTTFTDAACDEKVCNVGTSVGAGACSVRSTISGTLLCAVTFGLSCAHLSPAGPACSAIGSIIQDRVCSICGGDGLGFEDVVHHLGVLDVTLEGGGKTLLLRRSGFGSLKDTLKSMQGKNPETNQWYMSLSAKNKTLVEDLAKMIVMQREGQAKLKTMLNATDDLPHNIDLAQMITLYGTDISNYKDVEDKFNHLEKGKFGIIRNNEHVNIFTDAALDPSNGLELYIKKVFAMMIGGHVQNNETIYEALEENFCSPEVHNYLLKSLNKAILLHAIAVAMEGRKVSNKFLRDFRQNVIRASQSYYLHCGCPERYRELHNSF